MTLDRSKVWTGDLNAKALEPQPRVTVGLYDTTLRDGEQTVGVVLDPEQKLEIARALAAAGVDRIEAGFPRVSEDDARAIALILEAGLEAEIWGFSRAVRADVEALVELGVQASVIESPISDGKLAALGVSRETMLERIRVRRLVCRGARGSASRSSESTRRAQSSSSSAAAYESAVEAGAQEVVVVDTLGIATPEAAAFLVTEVVERLDYEVPVHWHGHDDFGLATAAAVAAVQAGATWVQGTVNGMGERAGNADLVEVALTLEALYGIPTRLRLEQARALGALVQELSGTQLAPWKPVTGETSSRASPAPSRRSSTTRRRSSRTPRSSSAPARDRPREEERARLDPDQGRGARARRARGALSGAARGGEARRDEEARPRHGRGVPAPRATSSTVRVATGLSSDRPELRPAA